MSPARWFYAASIFSGLGDLAPPFIVTVIFHGIRRHEAGDHSTGGDILPTQNSGMFRNHFTQYVKEQELTIF